MKEDFANKKYNPYQLIGKNGGVYTPFFYASDLQLVPKDSTGFSIYPSTANVEKLNSYDVVRRDDVVKENDEKNVIIKAVAVPVPKVIAVKAVTSTKSVKSPKITPVFHMVTRVRAKAGGSVLKYLKILY